MDIPYCKLMIKANETIVATLPIFIISPEVMYSFPFRSWRDTQQRLGKEDTGRIWEAVVERTADAANKRRCFGAYPDANWQTIGSKMVDETVCETKMLMIMIIKSKINTVTHNDVPPRASWIKSETRVKSPDLLTTSPSALPPITRKRIFHGSCAIREAGRMPVP